MKKVLSILLMFIAIHNMAQTTPAVYVCQPCGNACDTLTFTKEGLCSHCGMPLVNKANTDNKNLTVCFYLQDGVEVLDFAGPMEVFSNAGAKIFTVSKTKQPITSQGILKIIPDYDITDAPPYDVLAVFGGNAGRAANDPEVIAWIRSRQKTTQYYFSVCTGAFIFGKAGLLDSLTVTTFHKSIESLQKAVPTSKVLANTRFVDNGNIITTAGISAGIDGALHLVEKIKGRDYAQKIAGVIEYDKWVPEQGLIMAKKAGGKQ